MDLIRASLANANLRHARLRGADLDEAWLEGAKLYGADFSGARGLAAVHADGIDVGPDDQPDILRGEAAHAWLLRAAEGPRARSARCATIRVRGGCALHGAACAALCRPTHVTS
jgi:hypothetical protein